MRSRTSSTSSSVKVSNSTLDCSLLTITDGSPTPIFSTLMMLQEYITSHPPLSPPPGEPSSPKEEAEVGTISRTLFRSHHLLSTQKRKSIINWCDELLLYGISRVGYPGIIAVEGSTTNVIEFGRRLKGMNWLALSTRWTETVALEEGDKLSKVVNERVGDTRVRVIETDDLSKVGELMREAGLEEMFNSIHRMTG